MEPGGTAKRLWHVVRALYYMLRRGLCKKRLAMDLHLFLGRGKLAAGKAFRNILAGHHHGHGHEGGATSSASPASTSLYYPREVEFSCTTTPSYPPVFSFKNAGRRRGQSGKYGVLDAAAVARAFEMLNAENEAAAAGTPALMATPSPMLATSVGRSPAGVRQLRITDSPFPVVPEGDDRVDEEAEQFIRRFYEQLRMQATPRHG